MYEAEIKDLTGFLPLGKDMYVVTPLKSKGWLLHVCIPTDYVSQCLLSNRKGYGDFEHNCGVIVDLGNGEVGYKDVRLEQLLRCSECKREVIADKTLVMRLILARI